MIKETKSVSLDAQLAKTMLICFIPALICQFTSLVIVLFTNEMIENICVVAICVVFSTSFLVVPTLFASKKIEKISNENEKIQRIIDRQKKLTFILTPFVCILPITVTIFLIM